MADQLIPNDLAPQLATGLSMTNTNPTGQAQHNTQPATDSGQSFDAYYHDFFMAVDQAAHLSELLYDEAGQPLDWRFLQVNPAFERQTGLANVVGQLGSVVAPNTEPYWLADYDQVIKTGSPRRFENYNAYTQRWYAGYAYRVGPKDRHRFAVIFDDITHHKQQQQQQTYLLTLADVLRTHIGPLAITEAVTRLARQQFGADRCFVGRLEADQAIISGATGREDLPSLAGSYPASHLPLLKKTITQGQPVVVADVTTTTGLDQASRAFCHRWQVRSFMNVPITQRGQVIGVLCLAQAVPRSWTQAQIELARQTAERAGAALERATIEAALRQSEAKYRTLFESMDEGVCFLEVIFDHDDRAVDFRYLEHNQALSRLTGLTSAIIGQRASQVIPDLEAFWLQTYERVVRTGEPVRVEHQVAALDRWFEVHVSRAGGADSQVVVVLYTNITERKRAQQRQAYLLALGDVLRPLTTPLHIQEAVCQLLGNWLDAQRVNYAEIDGEEYVVAHEYRLEGLSTMLGRYSIDSFRPAERAAFTAGRTVALADIEADPTLTAGEASAYAALGVRAFVSVPLVKAGRLLTVLSVIRSQPGSWTAQEVELIEETAERTWSAVERARVEAALRQSEAALRNAIELAQLGTWQLDVASGQMSYSERLQSWLGVQEAILGQGASLQVDENDRERVTLAMARALEPGGSGRYEQEYTITNAHTGQQHIIHASGQTQFDPAGQPIRLAGMAQEVTQERALQRSLEDQVRQRTQELATVNDDLQRSNENLQQFAYVASHDLQEPLRKIQSFSTLIQVQLGEHADASVQQYLTRITAAGARMSTLIKDLLNYSRIATRQQAFDTVSLGAIVGGVLTVLEWEVEQSGAQLEIDALPLVNGDETQLSQLFQNLLANALKFVPPGQCPRIQIQYFHRGLSELPAGVHPAQVAPYYHQISVRDNGVGFDPKFLDRIFQVFQRLHSKHEYAGSGVGLAICQRVVENHGGAITANSQPGQGATFCVYLPAFGEAMAPYR